MTTQENASSTKGQPTSSAWASESTPTSSAEQLVEKTDKEIILDDLKQTMRDLGRIPRMIMAPVITYIASKWEHIPEERRSHLQKIVRDIKESGSDGMHHLKEWFGSKHEDAPAAATTGAQSQTAQSSEGIVGKDTTSKPVSKASTENSSSSTSSKTASKKQVSSREPNPPTASKPIISKPAPQKTTKPRNTKTKNV